MTPQAVEALVVEVVEEICQERGIQLPTLADDTILLGSSAFLDSVGLVATVMEIEARLSEDFDVDVSLTSDVAMSQERSPLRSIGSLRDFIVQQASIMTDG